MILRTLKETSIFILLIRRFIWGYSYLEKRLDEVYKNSNAYKIFKKTWDVTKTYFRNSFLGRITEIRDGDNTEVVNESRVVRWLAKFYKVNMSRLGLYFKASETGDLTEDFKQDFSLNPVRITSIIVITAVFSNILFSVLFGKEIGLLGWFVRGGLLFAGLAVLFSGLKWEDIKRTSFVINRFILKKKLQ